MKARLLGCLVGLSLIVVGTVWSQRSYFYFFSPTQVRAVAGTADFIGGAANYIKIGQLQDATDTNYVLDPAAAGNSLLTAGSIGIGTTVPDSTAKLTVSGSVSNTANSTTTYKDVYSYSDTGNPDTGTLAIELPVGWTNTMMRVKIVGYDYSANGAWEVTVGGYTYSTTPAWINYSAEVSGTPPFSSVRLGYKTATAHVVILLGTTATTWRYPKFTVTEVVEGHTLQGMGSGWSSSFLTSEAGIDNIVTATLKTYTTSGGNVGIGTTAPFANAGLTVHTPSGQISGIRVRSSADTRYRSDWGITSVGQALLNSYDDTGATYKLLYVDGGPLSLNTSSGANVGIGTTAPGVQLDVVGGDLQVSGYGHFKGWNTDNSSSGLGVDIGITSSAGWVAAINRTNSTYANLNLQGGSAGGTKLTVLTTGEITMTGGNVGIGTTSPTLGELQVEGGGGVAIRANSSGANAAMAGSSSSSGGTGTSGLNTSSGYGVYGSSSTGYDFYGAGPKSYFQGNVGIGVSPTYKLDVSGVIRASDEIISTGGNQFRMIGGNYGAFWRNDGTTLYLMFTASGNQYGTWNTLRPMYVNLATGAVTFGNGHADLAENYFVSGRVIKGSLVSVNNANPKSLVASDGNRHSLVGVVTTNPGAVMDADGGFHIGYASKGSYVNEKAPIALVGTVPTLIISQNGPVAIGDSISVSALPGFGAKAVTAGTIVGKAIEAFTPSDSSCRTVSSVDTISWPADDGKNPQKPCFKLPDGTYVGKIMITLNTSWYDPDLYFTSTGDMKIKGENGNYTLEDSGSLVSRIGAFAELVVAKIRVGLIDTKQLIVNGVDIMKKINELNDKVAAQQKEIDALKLELEELKNK